jgi:hypothetical protein
LGGLCSGNRCKGEVTGICIWVAEKEGYDGVGVDYLGCWRAVHETGKGIYGLAWVASEHFVPFIVKIFPSFAFGWLLGLIGCGWGVRGL